MLQGFWCINTTVIKGYVRICNVESLHWLTHNNKRQIEAGLVIMSRSRSVNCRISTDRTSCQLLVMPLLGDRCELDGTCSCATNYTGLACENHCPSGCNGKGACTGGRDCVFHLCFDETRQVAMDEGQSSEIKDFRSHCRPSKALKYLDVWVKASDFDVFNANVFNSFPCWILYEPQPMQIWLPKEFGMFEWDRSKRCQRDIQL